MEESSNNYSTCISCEKLLINDILNGFETLLPCNHTLCNLCEKESLNSQMCKSCGSDILYHFPNNYLKQLLILNQKQQEQLISTTIPTIPTTSVSISTSVSTSTSTSFSSSPRSSVESSDIDSEIQIENENGICTQHESKEFISFCMDCKVNICSDCIIDTHKEHKELQIDRNTINKFLMDPTEWLKTLHQQQIHNPYLTPQQQQQQQNSNLDHQLFEITKQIKLSKQFKQHSINHYTNEFKKIQEEFQLYQSILEYRKFYLLKFIENHFKSEQTQIDNQLKSLESQSDIIRKCLNDIKPSSTTEMNKLIILKNLSKINLKLTKLFINSNNVNNYQYQSPPSNMNDCLRSLGKINYSFKNNQYLLALSKERSYQFDIDSNHFLPYSELHQDSNPMKDTILCYKVITYQDQSNGNHTNNCLLTVSENSKSNQIEISKLQVKSNQIQSKIIIPLKSFKTNTSACIITTNTSSNSSNTVSIEQHQNLYLIGGINFKSKDYLKEIDKFNLSSNKYECSVANLSKPKYGCLTCFDGIRYIYIFGGIYKSLQSHSNARASIEIERLDITNNKCEIISKFQDPDLLDFNKSPLISCYYHQNQIYYLSTNLKFKRFNLLKNQIENLDFPSSSIGSDNNNTSISLQFDTSNYKFLLLLGDNIFYYPLIQLKLTDVSPMKWYPKYTKINSTDFNSSVSSLNLIGSRQSWQQNNGNNNNNNSSFLVQNLHGLLIYNETH